MMQTSMGEKKTSTLNGETGVEEKGRVAGVRWHTLNSTHGAELRQMLHSCPPGLGTGRGVKGTMLKWRLFVAVKPHRKKMETENEYEIQQSYKKHKGI